MAQKTGGLLDTFDDDDNDWSFGGEATKNKTKSDTAVIEQVKRKVIGKIDDDDDDDDEEDGGVTKLEDTGKVDKKKADTSITPTKKIVKKAKSKDEDEDDNDEEEEEEEEPEFNFGDEDEDDNIEKAKIKKKDKKKEDEEDDEEEEDTKTKSKKIEKIDKKEEEKQTEEEFFTELAIEFKDKGILQFVDLPKDKKITEDEFFELAKEDRKKEIDEVFEGFFEELDPDGAAFLQFKRDGGDTRKFLLTYGDTFELKSFNEENKAHVDKVLDYYLKHYEELDEEELEDKKKFFEDGGKSKAKAAKYYETIIKDQEEAKAKLVADQTKAAEKAIEDAKAFNDGLKKVLDASDTIGDFKINKVEQKELNNYITKPIIKVGKNQYIPELQSELRRILRGKTKEDKEHLILIAKLVRDKFKLPTETKQKVKTEVVKNIKSKLQDAKRGISGASSGMYGKKSLADMYDE